MSVLIPAATAILIRDGRQGLEVLLLRRSTALSFAPGLWVFPGGRVDAQDVIAGECELASAKRAAQRETQEETGLTIAAAELAPVSQWIPPKSLSKRFSTHFFITAYTAGAAVVVDGSEIDGYQWYLASQALQLQREQQLPMMPPTFITLTELAQFSNVVQALSYFRNREPLYYSASDWLQTDEDRCMLYTGDAGYDSDDASAQGQRHRLIDQNGLWIYQRSF